MIGEPGHPGRVRTQHLSRVALGREFSASDLPQGDGFAGTADEHHDGAALRQADFGDGQAPAATWPFRSGEAGPVC